MTDTRSAAALRVSGGPVLLRTIRAARRCLGTRPARPRRDGPGAKLQAAAAHLAEQNDEWTDARRYMGLEILAACPKARHADANSEGQENAAGADLAIGSIAA
jgi:hypothetical protein